MPSAMPHGNWRRSRAITLSVQMGAGQNIQTFQKAVNATWPMCCRRLPRDLIVEHTSDQPRAGAREHRSVHEKPVRGDSARGTGFHHRFLGMARGAADGARDSHHAADDVRNDERRRYRFAASLHRDADHRAGPVGGRSGSCRRRNPSRSGDRAARRSLPAGCAPTRLSHARFCSPPSPTSLRICRSCCFPGIPASFFIRCRW